MHDWLLDATGGTWTCGRCAVHYAPGGIVDPNCLGASPAVAPEVRGHNWQPDDDRGGDVCTRCDAFWAFEELCPENESCEADRGPTEPRAQCQKCGKELCEALDKVWDKGAWGKFCGWCWHLTSRD